MLSEQKIPEERVTTFAADVEITQLEIGNSRIGLAIILVMAGFIGVWGTACLLNGIAQSQNIQELGRGLVTAFTGI